MEGLEKFPKKYSLLEYLEDVLYHGYKYNQRYQVSDSVLPGIWGSCGGNKNTRPRKIHCQGHVNLDHSESQKNQ